jgi:hypothetical protein
VIQDVEEQNDVKTLVRMRDAYTVIFQDRHPKSWSEEYIDPWIEASGLAAITISSINPSPHPTSRIRASGGINSSRCLRSTRERRAVTNGLRGS